MNYLLIFTFGAAGAISRYAMDGWITNLFNAQFPWGTLVINILGSLVLGFVAEITTAYLINPSWRVALGIGFLGAFTTFCTFSYETVRLLQDSSFFLACINVAATLSLGLVAVYIGILIGRSI